MSHTVLLIDDEPHLLHSLARSLRHQPYKLLTARSAEEAIDIMKAHAVDLVVSDERMQGISGSMFLAWVTEFFPDTVRIMLTGQPSVPSMLSAINETHVYRYFTKPCSDVELALAIRDGLESQHPVQA